MKTLMLFDRFGEGEILFFELEGDYRHLDDVCINTMEDQEKQDELANLLWDENGNETALWENKLKEPTKDWDFFITTGFAP